MSLPSPTTAPTSKGLPLQNDSNAGRDASGPEFSRSRSGASAGFTDPRQVLTIAIEVVEAWRLNGDTAFAAGLGVLIRLLLTQKDTENAVRLHGAVTRTITLDAMVSELAQDIEAARIQPGPDRFDDLRAEGAQLSYQTAADLARRRIDVALAASHDDP